MSSNAGSPGSSKNAGLINKARLSDAQKKANHIESEKKRRVAIREGFDALSEIVPGMSGQGRSEAVVLQATVEHLREQLKQKEQLRHIALTQRGMSDTEFERVYAKAKESADEAESR